MTDPVLSLEPTHVAVEPGGQARVVVSVTNEGSIVEGYTVEVVDEVSAAGRLRGPASWYRVLSGDGVTGSADAGQPGTVSILPQHSVEVVVVLAPEAGTGVASGTFAFAVRASSQAVRGDQAAVEGVVEIGRVHGLQAKLVPVTSKGRWRGRHVVQVSNWGNAPARLRLVASDADQALGFLVRPDVLDVPLGATATARVKVRTRSPSLRGQPARMPFSIAAEPDPSRPVVDGAFAQRPILSRGVAAAGAVALVAGVALGVFAFTSRGPGAGGAADFSLPATPELAAKTLSESSIRLSWKRIDDLTGYKLLTVDPTSKVAQDEKPVGADLGAQVLTGLEAGTTYCFQLVALTGAAKSPPSAAACARTSPAPGASTTTGAPTSGTTTTTGSPTTTTTTTPPPVSFTPDQWLGVVYVAPELTGTAEAQATRRQQELASAGVATKVLPTRPYGSMQPAFKNPAWLVYLGPFGSEQEARSSCATPPPTVAQGWTCTTVRPVSRP